jgi:serine/threonine protein phosphatase PrpC
VNVSVKGARNNNEDAIYADGQMFAVYDGHGGKHASLLAQAEIAKQYYQATGNASGEKLVAANKAGTPVVVDALDEAYAATQAAMPTSHAKSQAGSTGVTVWVHPSGGGGVSKVYLACLGDSQAIMFDAKTGNIPTVATRLWDEEQGTLLGEGVQANRPSVTEPHAITGALKVAIKRENTQPRYLRVLPVAATPSPHTFAATHTHTHARARTHTITQRYTRTEMREAG